jgi:hypothetical protein
MIKHETVRTDHDDNPDFANPRALKAAMEYQWERRGLCCATGKARWLQTDEDGRLHGAGHKLGKVGELE